MAGNDSSSESKDSTSESSSKPPSSTVTNSTVGSDANLVNSTDATVDTKSDGSGTSASSSSTDWKYSKPGCSKWSDNTPDFGASGDSRNRNAFARYQDLGGAHYSHTWPRHQAVVELSSCGSTGSSTSERTESRLCSCSSCSQQSVTTVDSELCLDLCKCPPCRYRKIRTRAVLLMLALTHLVIALVLLWQWLFAPKI